MKPKETKPKTLPKPDKTPATKTTEPDDYFDESVTFKSLNIRPEILKQLELVNYRLPTKIQRESLKYSLAGRDIIGLAETGSGKTLAFILPIIQQILELNVPDSKGGPHALILCPTRELCIQIREHIEAIGRPLGVSSCVIIGNVSLLDQAVALVNRRPHVVVATPGRLLHHLENTKGFDIKRLRCLVLDEADKLLSMNFEDSLDRILNAVPKGRKTYLFSATMTNKVNKLQRASLKNPVKVEVSSRKHQTVQTLTQEYLFLPFKYREAHLVQTVNQHLGKSCIVFVTTCKQVIRVVLLLRNLGFDCVPIHGQMTQVKRLQSLSKFKSKQNQLLVATDVASRGLDIPSVDLVLNFEIPANPKDYVHRVGRTARAGRAGLAITLVTQYDVEAFQKIEKCIGIKMEQHALEQGKVMEINSRVQEAIKIAQFELKSLLAKRKNRRRALDIDEGPSGNHKRRKRVKKN